MPAFTCYRLHRILHGRVPDDLDEYIDLEDQAPEIYGPASTGDFEAKLYVHAGPPHPPGWASFVQDGFDEASNLPLTASVGAAIVLRLIPEGHVFAFTFGITGRFLLKHEAWKRGYGLQAALNLIYPRAAGSASEAGRLVAVDAKKRGGDIIRSRQQASRATTFEAFEVDKLRDLVGGATGRPYDDKWGRRITGTDALNFATDSDFAGLGKLCRDLTDAHDREDYKDRFGWLDSIRPINDPELLSQIQDHLVGRMIASELDDLDLAPPEIIDWSRVTGFQYHYDMRKKFTRPEIQLTVYLHNLPYFEDDADSIDIEYFRRKSIRAVDADDREVHRWSVWRCLCGEFQFEDVTYVIDEGEIFEVSSDYLKNLNEVLTKIASRDALAWPAATPTTSEDAFNGAVANALAPAVVMDKKLVKGRMQTTEVEVCDVLTADRQLIHAKRHLGSRDLSHLFSQGFVSANLLQSDSLFRQAAHAKVKSLGGGRDFDFFDVESLPAADFEVIFVIVAGWCGRDLIDALPFFSKVNLERAVEDLLNRGFKVAVARVDTGLEPPRKRRAKTAA